MKGAWLVWAVVCTVPAVGAGAAAARPLLKAVPLRGVAANSGTPVAADVNGDGKPDLLVADGRKLLVLLGDGKGFGPPSSATNRPTPVA
jgi:hypothetical protein